MRRRKKRKKNESSDDIRTYFVRRMYTSYVEFGTHMCPNMCTFLSRETDSARKTMYRLVHYYEAFRNDSIVKRLPKQFLVHHRFTESHSKKDLRLLLIIHIPLFEIVIRKELRR